MRYVYITLGFICFVLGSIGALLPILPTTPFLLLASFFFAKGSKRFHNWFCQTKLYKKHIESFVKTRSMTAKTKAILLIGVSAMLLTACIFVNNIYMWAFIGVVIAVKYYYFIFVIKTSPKAPKK